ncbi:MAG: phosphatidylinositol-specific phospholipase C1-like protein [Flavobacteriaceae bacterium]
MKTYCNLFITLITVLVQSQDNGNQQLTDLKLNDIQVIGSHNSYKIAIEKPLMDYLLNLNPATSSLEYEHISLSEQLNLGLRGLELDVFHDPEGGFYSNPAGLDIVRSTGQEPLAFDPHGKLKEAGLKIFHVQDIDFRSHQLLFKEALEELVSWSNANPGHTPIIITINTKDGLVPRTRDPLPFDADALKNIDVEIRDVLSEEQLITPDLVRGNFETLEEAVIAQGWPFMKDVMNRFLFVLDEGDIKSDLYLSQFPQLKGAVLFVNKKEGHPQAAFQIINDAVGKFDQIKKLVAKGYMVRTRADSDTREARGNDYTKFEKAKASGAQIITTDYYMPSTLFESDYKVKFDDGKFERIKN